MEDKDYNLRRVCEHCNSRESKCRRDQLRGIVCPDCDEGINEIADLFNSED
jgi:hypothetical protein